MPIKGSLANTADVTASTRTSASTPSQILHLKAAILSLERL